jgi:uncharacterized protein YecE (DUF72 family)
VGRTFIGISGWRYPGWRGDFYPAGLVQRRELEFASREVGSIEINGSFYSLQRPESYRRWREETPAGFVFAVKGSRFITHNKRLGEVERPLANFFASGVLLLEEKLGPFLWQLPPNVRYDETRVRSFLERLPRDTRAAADLARGHDERVVGRSSTEARVKRRLRHAIEPRHPSFFVQGFARLCRRHRVTIGVSDSGDWPCTEEVTADFMYLRLHGSRQTYASRYADEELDRWAERIRAWRSGRQPDDASTFSGLRPPTRASRDVYVYFDNDAKVHAPKDARRLIERLSGSG